jgi:23S rRNA (uracil1939-C5)-methyltransferase
MPDQLPVPDLFETTIEKLITGGAGLGRCEGMAAFIPLTAPGDQVRARITRRKRGFIEAELSEVLIPGPGRVAAPACPHFGACGGCDLQHLDGAAQRAAKAEIVVDCFRRQGKIDVTGLLETPASAGPELGYRDRIRLSTDHTGRHGLLRRGSQEVMPIDTCPQMPALFNETILPWLRTMPPVQHVLVRLDGAGGCLVSMFGLPNRLRLLRAILKRLPEGEAPLPGCTGILFNNLPAWGRDYLLVRLAGRTYRVGANSFFQSNPTETEAVVATARAWLDEARPAGGLLADVYCGVGLFGLALADRFDHVLMVEAEGGAVRDARINAVHAKGLEATLEVHEAAAATALTGWAGAAETGAEDAAAAEAQATTVNPTREDWAGACVFVDPPRAGVGEAVTAALERLAPRDILYLSCDPATLARDVAALAKGGYALRRLRLFDMFPQTSHVEVLAYLTRG